MEIEALLEWKSWFNGEGSGDEFGEQRGHYFRDYQEALQFLKGKKGLWYITPPGLKNLKDRKW